MSRTRVFAMVGFLMVFGTIAVLEAESRPSILVFKSPLCGCCTEWVAYLEDDGFSVRVEDVPDLRGIKDSYDVLTFNERGATTVFSSYR